MILGKYWKILMWLPIIFLLVSVAILGNNIATKGSFLEKDIDLSGGKVITVEIGDVDIAKIKAALPYANVKVTTGLTKNLLVEIPFDRNESEVIEYLENEIHFTGEPGIRVVGPALGDIFFQQAQTSLIFAFIMMAIVVFILFRSIAPSTIVLLAVATDIIGTMGVLSLLGMPISLSLGRCSPS